MSQRETSSAANPSAEKPWTPSQLAAIAHHGGDLLVSAAAGSGKTAVLAERCARLVCGDDPGERCGIENLLVLTFTEAAAGEMKTRIAAAITRRLKTANRDERWLLRQAAMVDRAAISTLHAFCARILRQHFHEAGVDPAFEVMDQDEARLLQEEVLETLMARWHRLEPDAAAKGPSKGVTATGFETFFEAYAQGNEAACARIILDVHRMLTTTEDPAQFQSDARAVFAEKAEAVVLSHFKEILADQVRLAGIAAERARAEAASHLFAERILERMDLAVAAAASARLQLEELKSLTEIDAAAARVRDLLETPWEKQLRKPKDVDAAEFEDVKDRTFEAVKESFRKLQKQFQVSPSRMLSDLKSLAAPLETLLAMVAEFENEYAAAKQNENHLDFADLERFALKLLTSPHNLAALDLRQRFRHVLVDEFQDINPLQAALLQAVRNPASFQSRGNLFVVGDVKQSIYGFRLADPALFIARENAALAADEADPLKENRRHVALQENFRSQPQLLQVMNGIFERLLTPEVAGVDYARGHALKSTKPSTDSQPDTLNGIPVEVHLVALDAGDTDDLEETSDPHSIDADPDPSPPSGKEPEEESASAMELEAQLVAQRIADLIHEGKALLQKDGTPRKIEYRDIAILMRSARARGMIFARALAARGIPVHADLQSGFFDTPEVQNAVALLQILDNPRQDIPLATALLGPFGAFSHDDLALIRLTFNRKEVSFAQAVEAYPLSAPDGQATRNQPYLQQNAPPFSPQLAARLNAFFNKLIQWREKLRGRPLHEGLAAIFAESGIFTYLAALDAGPQRVANLQMLHQRALAFASFRKQGLHRFLRFIEKLRQQEEADGGEAPILSEASNVVRIMTIHKSKGLEFPVVFVSGLGAQLRLTGEGPILLHRALGVGLSVVDLERNIYYPSAASLRIRDAQRRDLRAEELRLLYVAITRARDALFLTGHLRKAAEIDTWRSTWHHHAGPLPEDILLKGRRALDWLMPVLAMATGKSLNITWTQSAGTPSATPNPTPQVIITLHGNTEFVARPTTQTPSAAAAKILAGLPLSSAPDDSLIAALIQRVTARYAFEDQARQPAVQTVSFLKTLVEDREATEESVPLPGMQEQFDTAPAASDAERLAQTEAARLRGLATHRVLELLDFAACDSPEKVAAQIAALIHSNQLTQPETDRADWPGIHWFLWNSATGPRLAAAARLAASKPATAPQLRRELPFAWIGTLDPSPADPEDLPTIRGVIDVLLVNPSEKRAEIIDYKTDSARLWESRVEDYRRQMHYYMAAAGDILGYKIEKATLIFLSAHREVELSPIR